MGREVTSVRCLREAARRHDGPGQRCESCFCSGRSLAGGGHVGQQEDHLETLSAGPQICAFCICYSRCLAGIPPSPFFTSTWSKICLFLPFLLHRALALGIAVLAAVTPVSGLRDYCRCLGPVAMTPSCRAWQGMSTGKEGGGGHVPACCELALERDSGQWGPLRPPCQSHLFRGLPIPATVVRCNCTSHFSLISRCRNLWRLGGIR